MLAVHVSRPEVPHSRYTVHPRSASNKKNTDQVFVGAENVLMVQMAMKDTVFIIYSALCPSFPRSRPIYPLITQPCRVDASGYEVFSCYIETPPFPFF